MPSSSSPVLPSPEYADLHAHLYGSVPPDAVLQRLVEGATAASWEWFETNFVHVFGRASGAESVVARARVGDPDALRDFRAIYLLTEVDGGSFARFSAKGRLCWAAWAGPEKGMPESVVYADAAVRHFESEGAAYVELRHTPDEALLGWMAHRPGACQVRLAATLDRDDPWRDWRLVKQLALSPDGAALTGIDFCGDEEGRPPRGLAPFIAAVRDFNGRHPARALALLVHVGESFGDKSLESAVRWVQEAAELGAHRLGHAIALGVDVSSFGRHTRTEHVSERLDQIRYDLEHAPGLLECGVDVDPDALVREAQQLARVDAGALMEVRYDADRLAQVTRRQQYALSRVRITGAVIEVCPTSNGLIAGLPDPARHPIHRFLRAGLPVVIGTDDAGQFDTTMNRELDLVAGHASTSAAGGASLRHRLQQAAWLHRSEVLTGRIPS